MYADNLLIAEPIAQKVWYTGRTIVVEPTDGRSISFPADRFKILAKANDEIERSYDPFQRVRFTLG